MAKETQDESKKVKVPEMVSQALSQLANLLGVAITELWTIFVKQYIVAGANHLFTAIVCFVGAFFLKDYIGFWALIPVVVGIGMVYGAIAYLFNPKYYALEDITDRIREFNKKESEKRDYRY